MSGHQSQKIKPLKSKHIDIMIYSKHLDEVIFLFVGLDGWHVALIIIREQNHHSHYTHTHRPMIALDTMESNEMAGTHRTLAIG